MGQKNCTRGAQSEIDHNEGISLWETKYLIIHIIFFGPLAGSGESPIIYIGRLLLCQTIGNGECLLLYQVMII